MNSKIDRVIEEAEAELAAAEAKNCGTCKGQRVQVVIDDEPMPMSPCPECGRLIRILHILPDVDDDELMA